MTDYTGVRYEAINPKEFGESAKGAPHPATKILESLTDSKGEIDYAKLDKLAGRRINSISSDTWFIDVFQCVQRPFGEQLTTTIGELAESMSNEHFSQFPVLVDRVKSILNEAEVGILKTWTLSQDIEVGFVTMAGEPLSSYYKDGTLLVGKKGGIIVSGRHRLTSIMTILEYGFKLPYKVYSQFKIRVKGISFPTAEKMAHYVRLANTTRRMSTPEKANIKTQIKHGAGSTSSIEKQIGLIIGDKAKSIDQKGAFATLFRLITQGDTWEGSPVTDITRYTIGAKLFDALFSPYRDDAGEKHHQRFDRTKLSTAIVSRILQDAASTYKEGFADITNIARNGIEPAVSVAASYITDTYGGNYDTPRIDESFTVPSLLSYKLDGYEPLTIPGNDALDKNGKVEYIERVIETEAETVQVEAEPVTPKTKRTIAKRKAL